jgi:hypothetical protein
MAISDVNYTYDAANVFRAPNQPEVTTSGDVGTLALDYLKDVRPSSQRNTLASQEYRVIIVVESFKADIDEFYEVIIRTGAGLVSTQHGRFPIYSLGQHVFILDSRTMQKQATDLETMTLRLEVTGTDPGIAFSAWLI